MKFKQIILIIAGSLSFCSGQIGYRFDLARHTYDQKSVTNVGFPKVNINSIGPQIGIDYWLRLKNYRIEFLPGFQLGADFGRNSIYQSYEITDIQIQANLPILLYPLSFMDDCHCPTFKKEGTTVKKGLHFIFQGGYALNRRNANHDSVTTSSSTTTPSLAFGAGLDFGISRVITLTPFILSTHYFGETIKPNESVEVSVQHSSINFGIRMRIQNNKRKF